MTGPRPIDSEALRDISLLSFDSFREKYACGSSYWRRVKLKAAEQLTGKRLDPSLPLEPRLPPLGTLHSLPEELRIDEPVIVAGDWHIPFHDRFLVDALLAVADKEDIRTIILNGDVMSQDVFRQGGFARQPSTPNFEEEMQEVSKVIGILSEQFDGIVAIPGNHERRMLRMLSEEVSMSRLYQMILGGLQPFGFQTTERDYVVVDHDHGEWRVTHGDSGGSVRNPIAAPIQKAMIYQQNVLQGHSHLLGYAPTPDGRFLAGTHGCIVDPAALEYKNIRTTTFPNWTQGFASIVDGFLTLYSKQHTNWGKVLG